MLFCCCCLFVCFVVVKNLVMAFFSHARIFRRGFFDESILGRAFLLKWRSARAHQFQSLSRGQTTVAQRAERIVAERSMTSCVRALFPDRFPHYAWTAKSAHSNAVGSRMYADLSVAGHLPFWQNDLGPLRATDRTDTEIRATTGS